MAIAAGSGLLHIAYRRFTGRSIRHMGVPERERRAAGTAWVEALQTARREKCTRQSAKGTGGAAYSIFARMPPLPGQ